VHSNHYSLDTKVNFNLGLLELKAPADTVNLYCTSLLLLPWAPQLSHNVPIATITKKEAVLLPQLLDAYYLHKAYHYYQHYNHTTNHNKLPQPTMPLQVSGHNIISTTTLIQATLHRNHNFLAFEPEISLSRTHQSEKSQ